MIEFDEDSEEKTEPEYERDDDGRIVLRLKYPVHHGQRVIDTLRVRDGVLGDLRTIAIGGAGIKIADLIVISARMAGEEKAVIEKLRKEDAEILAIALRFFTGCLTSGLTG